MQAKISLCVIVKNEPLLENCILSVKEHVDEIVIVDTGSTDESTQNIAKKYADKFEIFTDCNDPDTGLINDFSLARERSFQLASYPWIIWADCDDIIEGGENLRNIVEAYDEAKSGVDGVGYLFPYEYSYDVNGECTCRHYRERLIYNRKAFSWRNPVHEVLCPNDNMKVYLTPREEVVFKHRRQFSSKIPEVGRNLRILKKYIEKIGDSDARQLYYIGLEYSNIGAYDDAIKALTKYIEISGWDDERAMACLKLVDIYQVLGNYQEGTKWALQSIGINENWGEVYFAAAKMFYYLAMAGGANEYRNWERVVNFVRKGLALPPTRTLLFVNPLERECEIHKYLNMALNKLGDVKGALESVLTGLKKQPHDPNFVNNKKLYEIFLAKHEIYNAINKLKEVGSLEQSDINTIFDVLNKKPLQNFPDYKKSKTYPKGITEDQFPTAINTPHSQAWGIPSTVELDGLPVRMTDEQLQATVIMIWKQYILHDELLAAQSFLENAPFNVRDTKITNEALIITQKMLGWLKDPILLQKYNAPVNPDIEIDVPMPHPLNNNQSGGRFNLIVNELPKHKTSIVDFGCVDGCFTNRYGLLGHEVYGLDLVETSVALANKKAIEFNTGVKHVVTYFKDAVDKVPNGYFEYATSTDTYEHVVDPVADIFLPAKKMLNENGKFLLCTPYGSWMRGNFLPWAHPWLWSEEDHNWLYAHPRGHLVAPSSWSVIKHFRQAGYYVKNCYPVLCESLKDVENQGNIFAEAHVKYPSTSNQLEIVFYIGDGVEFWTPQSIKKNGIGGSETMACEMAKKLAAFGHRVKVYSGCGPHGEGIYDGVEYYQSHKYQDVVCDVLIISRRTDMLADKYNVTAKLKLLWVHDVYALNATNELLLKADRILVLSEWHKQNVINHHNLHPDHIIITNNAIDLNRFNKSIVRNKFKAINSSSPDRSWPVLLDCWPKIKEKVPEAELHLFYGFKNWEHSAQYSPGHAELIYHLKSKIDSLKSQGVVYHDRVNQEQLAEEMLSAGVLLYPTWFFETYFIGGAEAQAAGLRIVSSPIAAINETVGDRAFALISGDWMTKEYQDKFIESAVAALSKEDESDRIAIQQYAANNFGLESLSKNWEKMFYDLINDIKINPVVPYQPTNEYKK